ncbi:MAG: hypothetical protein ACRC8M_07370 [Cetobacterium sp.]|uniref:hypothetical protein n=1 Tax=Cetobacterium sp. TaxID=2071632 RepID=UPI003F2DFD67
MKIEILSYFKKELVGLKRGKFFIYEIMKKLILLEELNGFIPNQTKKIKAHDPLMELKYEDVRVFYMIKDSEILVVGILKKDVNKFPSKTLEIMRKRGE